tara:strand:+ start:398 stop:613 length:216 start_codon:yes stop_codon:yes gene_type:complete
MRRALCRLIDHLLNDRKINVSNAIRGRLFHSLHLVPKLLIKHLYLVFFDELILFKVSVVLVRVIKVLIHDV